MKSNQAAAAGDRRGWYSWAAAAAMLLAAATLLLGGCSSGPFKHHKFVATPYPSDFALKIIENYDSHISHQYVQQTIRASTMTSVTVFSTVEPDGAAVVTQTAIVRHVTVNELQAMWNAIRRHGLMHGAGLWDFWHSASDRYVPGAQMVEIRAGGERVLVHQLYHWNNSVADLVLLCEPLQLPAPGEKPIVTTNNPKMINSAAAPAAASRASQPTSTTATPANTSAPKPAGQ